MTWLLGTPFEKQFAAGLSHNLTLESQRLNNVGRSQQTLLVKWKLRIQECGWSDYRDISVLYEKVVIFTENFIQILSVEAKPIEASNLQRFPKCLGMIQ